MSLASPLASISKAHAAVRKFTASTPILRTSYQGITVDIERTPGFVQSGISAEGKAWTRVYGYRPDGTRVDTFRGYGSIPGTNGIDDEEIDVYLGADPTASVAFLITQGDPDPEHKLMLGFADVSSAVDCYLAHVPARMLAGIVPIPIALVQSLLACGEITKGADGASFADRIEKAAVSERRGCAIKKAANYAANVIYARADEPPPPTKTAAGEWDRARAAANATWLAGDPSRSELAPQIAPCQTMIAAPDGFAHPCVTTNLSGAYVGAFASGWLGWIEPQPRPSWNPRDPAWTEGVGRPNVNSLDDWIAFVGIDGTGLLWEQREGGDGGVIGTPILFRRSPERRAEDLALVGATMAVADLPDLAAIADLLRSQQATQKNAFEQKTCTFEVTTNGDTIEAIKRVLLVMQRMGEIGHSTPIYYDDDGLREAGGIDGDGPGRISKIVVDGETLGPAAAVVQSSRVPPLGYFYPLTEEQKARYGGAPGAVAKTDEIKKRQSTAHLLLEAGPPDEWSGPVASVLGDRKADLVALWRALDAPKQQAVRAAWRAFFDAETVALDLEDEYHALAKTDAPQNDAFQVEAAFITKSIDEELRYVLGYVLEPLDGHAGEADTQGDFYNAETIREAMWGYMMFFRNVSLNHKAYLNGRVFVVECWQTKVDQVIDGSQIRKGTWMLGIFIPDDEIWGMVSRGELRALSIGGTAEKVPFAA